MSCDGEPIEVQVYGFHGNGTSVLRIALFAGKVFIEIHGITKPLPLLTLDSGQEFVVRNESGTLAYLIRTPTIP